MTVGAQARLGGAEAEQQKWRHRVSSSQRGQVFGFLVKPVNAQNGHSQALYVLLCSSGVVEEEGKDFGWCLGFVKELVVSFPNGEFHVTDQPYRFV